VLSGFPLTSMAVLPLRLMLTTVPWWAVVLALVPLAAATWFFRRAAGNILGTAVLMYCREPTLREGWRWAREA
jgi:hypothetical protein